MTRLVARYLEVPEEVIRRVEGPFEDQGVMAAWLRDDALLIIRSMRSAGIVVIGVDGWWRNSDGDIDGPYIPPAVWSRRADETEREFLERSAHEAEAAVVRIKAPPDSTLLVSTIPQTSVSHAGVVAWVPEAPQ